MSVLAANNYPANGDTFTLSFQPTGLGNPFDSPDEWFAAGANNGNFTVVQVTMNGGFFTSNEIDVVIRYAGIEGDLSYGDIASYFTAALNSVFYGYTLLGVQSGAQASLPGSSLTPIGSSSSITSTLVYIGLGIAVIAVAIGFLKKEV